MGARPQRFGDVVIEASLSLKASSNSASAIFAIPKSVILISLKLASAETMMLLGFRSR